MEKKLLSIQRLKIILDSTNIQNICKIKTLCVVTSNKYFKIKSQAKPQSIKLLYKFYRHSIDFICNKMY